MKKSKVLLIDAFINFMLGIILVIFPLKLVWFLGLPEVQNTFYPSILGAVLLGIGVALLIEYFRKPYSITGLGLGGAITINLCGALILVVWLLSSSLNIPIRGQIILWILVITLIVVSGFELLIYIKKDNKKSL